MPLNYRKFSQLDDAILFLKGHIIGGVDVPRTPGALYLNGKTLVLNTPAGTVSFATSPASDQAALTMAEVISQIESDVAGLSARFNKGRLELWTTTPGAISLDLTGTANAYFGFDTAADTVGAVYGVPGAAAPALVSIVPEHGSNSYLVVVNDS